MKKLLILLMLLPLFCRAQFYIGSDTLVVKGNEIVYVNGDFYTDKTAKDQPYISLTDSLSVTKDVNLNSNTVISGNGWLNMCGTDTQYLESNGIALKNLVICNPKAVKLSDDLQVQESLQFMGGKLFLGNSNFHLGIAGSDSGWVTGAGYDAYVVTNGNGSFSRYSNGAVIYPVGNSSYNPILIANNGTADDLSVRVEDAVYGDYWPLANIQTINAISRAWYVGEGTTGGSNATVTVYWADADELSSFARGASAIGWYNSGMKSWDKATVQPAMAAGNLYSQSRSGLTTFNTYFGVGGLNSPVPVELIDFMAAWQKPGIEAQLTWTTASERNCSHFEIERSTDGRQWTNAGHTDGHGNSSRTQLYSFLDLLQQTYTAPLYYRLRQVDFDGSFSYSPVRMLKVPGSETAVQVQLWPNPASNELGIHTSSEQPVSVALLDATGKVLLKEKISGNKNLNTTTLASGIYFLRIRTNDGVQKVKKVVIKK